jgi:hypothetical protein
MPLASLPRTSDAMRYEPAVSGAKVKLADSPGWRPRWGSGVLQSGWIGWVALPFFTTAHELGTVERFAHCTVTCHPTGTLSTSEPLPYPS